jgi:hypothetical protein
LRLRGRDETAVWGVLVFSPEETGQERTQSFRFELDSWLLYLEDGKQVLQLDEMGVVEKRVGN